jgi:hypothetical protein
VTGIHVIKQIVQLTKNRSSRMAKSSAKPSSGLVRENAVLMAEANSLYSQINSAWEKAEHKLREFGILKPFQVFIETDDHGEQSSLGVAKDGGKWRIFLVTSHVQDPDAENKAWTLITECPVDSRVYFVEHIPKLFDKLVDSNREAVENLRTAASKSAEMLKHLNFDI